MVAFGMMGNGSGSIRHWCQLNPFLQNGVLRHALAPPEILPYQSHTCSIPTIGAHHAPSLKALFCIATGTKPSFAGAANTPAELPCRRNYMPRTTGFAPCGVRDEQVMRATRACILAPVPLA